MTLSILVKWIAQTLIMTSGISAALVAQLKLDPVTGQRRLTRLGWIAVGALSTGFLAFAVSDIDERGKARERAQKAEQEAATRLEQIENQKLQIRYLQQLGLMQERLAGVEVSWDLPDKSYERMLSFVDKATEEGRINAYVQAALRSGEIQVRRDGRDWIVELLYVQRPQGLLAPQKFPAGSPEYTAFEEALKRFVLNDRLWIELSADHSLIDLLRRDWPVEARLSRRRILWTVRDPGVGLHQLKDAEVVFCAAAEPRDQLPERVRVRSLDSRVALDQAFELHWRPRTVQVVKVRDQEDELVDHEIQHPQSRAVPLEAAVAEVFGGDPVSDQAHK